MSGLDKHIKKVLRTLTFPINVYSIETQRGYTWKRYGPREGRDDDDKAAFDERWSGGIVNGIPTHSEAPTTQGTVTGTGVGYQVSERGQDEHELCYWFRNDSSLPLEIKDNDPRAESLRVYTGCKCSANLSYERYQSEGTPWNSGGANVAVVPPHSVLKVTALIHDPGPDFSGFLPVGNYEGSEETVPLVSYTEEPRPTCVTRDLNICDPQELAEGETYKPIDLDCETCGSAAPALDADAINDLIVHPDPPEQRICKGPFIGCTGRTGWLYGWSPVTTNAAVPTFTTDWRQVGRAWTGPDCVHDMQAIIDVGNHYFLLRRIRSYLWINVRLLRNGVPCGSEAYDTYEYIDERGENTPSNVPPIQYILYKPGNSNICCFNNAPKAVWTTEVQYRYTAVSPQSDSYFRYIGGLRSEASYVTMPRDTVVGRI